MRESHRRPIAILIILSLALIIGIGVELLWTLVDKNIYPQKYSDYVVKYASMYNVPEDVIYATIKVESSFDPNAVSVAGAKGLMQLMPSTFEWLSSDEHLGEGLKSNMLFDPETNIKYGTYYLKYLYTKFDYNWETVYAAYNGGEGNVINWLADSTYSDGNGNLTDFPKEFGETENYVRKMIKTRNMYLSLYYR